MSELEQIANAAMTKVVAFLSNEIVWYVLAGAVAWEVVRRLVVRRAAPTMNEAQFINRFTALIQLVVVAVWVGLTYKMYGPGMPAAEWGVWATFFVHLVLTVCCAAGVAYLRDQMKAA